MLFFLLFTLGSGAASLGAIVIQRRVGHVTTEYDFGNGLAWMAIGCCLIAIAFCVLCGAIK